MSSASEELLSIIHADPCDVAQVAALLDGLSPTERLQSVRSLGRSEQRRLWKAAEGKGVVRLVDLVPPSTPDMTPVRHHGRNSQPVLKLFEKRFCRPSARDPEAPGELWGLNVSPIEPLAGPGYFVAVDDEQRGEVIIDYRRIPVDKPAEWPRLRPNERGLSRLVYGFMVDTLRRVSEHVTIGSAARHGRDLNAWFVLCRES